MAVADISRQDSNSGCLILKPTLTPVSHPSPQGLLRKMAQGLSPVPSGGSSQGTDSPTEKFLKRCGVLRPDWVADQLWHLLIRQ